MGDIPSMELFFEWENSHHRNIEGTRQRETTGVHLPVGSDERSSYASVCVPSGAIPLAEYQSELRSTSLGIQILDPTISS